MIRRRKEVEGLIYTGYAQGYTTAIEEQLATEGRPAIKRTTSCRRMASQIDKTAEEN